MGVQLNQKGRGNKIQNGILKAPKRLLNHLQHPFPGQGHSVTNNGHGATDVGDDDDGLVVVVRGLLLFHPRVPVLIGLSALSHPQEFMVTCSG